VVGLGRRVNTGPSGKSASRLASEWRRCFFRCPGGGGCRIIDARGGGARGEVCSGVADGLLDIEPFVCRVLLVAVAFAGLSDGGGIILRSLVVGLRVD